MDTLLGVDHQPDFYRWLISRRLVKATTADDYLRDVRRVAKHAGVGPQELRSRHLEDFLADPRYSPSTKQRAVIASKMWHKWGADRDLWPRDIDLLDLRVRKPPPASKPALTLDQAKLLLQCAHTPLQMRFAFTGLYAGLRPSEIRFLDGNSWFTDLDGRQTILVQGKSTSPERSVPVHPVLVHLRDEILSTGVPSRRKMIETAAWAREQVGVCEFQTRWLRRTFGRAVRSRGGQRDVISSLLGHSIGGVTERHYVPVEREEQVRDLYALRYGIQLELTF